MPMTGLRECDDRGSARESPDHRGHWIKNSNLISEVLVKAATGLNGTCTFIDNPVAAPIVKACE